MSNLPDFSSYGYQITEQLGYNPQGGRVTYKAIELQTQKFVVIKYFQFALPGTNWSTFKAHEREIEVLRSLDHPNIPRYLDVFEPPTGFCLVQDYKNAQPLSTLRSFAPDEIKRITISILEILVYLQNRIPSIIHRDIKPENVLIDEQLNVYLVDFGFAKIGSGEITAISSMVVGTTDFMPPEQLRNLQLTKASDLYSLGVTIICLITGTRSNDIGKLINLGTNRLNFKHLVPQFSFQFIQWLEKMVEPDPNQRYSNAETALNALKPVDLIRLPEVQLSESSLNFQATRLGESLSQTITISNPIPDTILEGNWEVKSHQSAPPRTPDSHAWIFFNPKRFKGNSTQCRITVDTSKLVADKVYERWLLLHTNSAPETYTIKIKVQTAPIPIETRRIPYISLVLVFIASLATVTLVDSMTPALFMAQFMTLLIAIRNCLAVVGWALIGAFVGAFLGFAVMIFVTFPLLIFNAFKLTDTVTRVGTVLGGVLGGVLGITSFFGITDFLFDFLNVDKLYVGLVIALLTIIGVGGWAISRISIEAVANFVERGFRKSFELFLSCLTAGFGISLALGLAVGFSNPHIILALAATSLPVATMTLYLPLKRRRLITKYRASEQHLIKP